MYTVPGSQGKMPGYYAIGTYDYYLIRGFAVIEAGGIGTYGSEGYELCGSDLERDSHKCVVEWLHGDRTAYTNIWKKMDYTLDADKIKCSALIVHGLNDFNIDNASIDVKLPLR